MKTGFLAGLPSALVLVQTGFSVFYLNVRKLRMKTFFFAGEKRLNKTPSKISGVGSNFGVLASSCNSGTD
jgi:hypothetical protein